MRCNCSRIGAAHELVEAGFDVAAIANSGSWKSLKMPNYYTRELRAKQSAMPIRLSLWGKITQTFHRLR
jgi:hypothetical protein